jgi:hypothetical protein
MYDQKVERSEQNISAKKTSGAILEENSFFWDAHIISLPLSNTHALFLAHTLLLSLLHTHTHVHTNNKQTPKHSI